MIEAAGPMWLDLSSFEAQISFGKVGDISRLESKPFVLLGQEAGEMPAVCMLGPDLARQVREARAFRGLDPESGDPARFEGISIEDALTLRRGADVSGFELAQSVTEAARLRAYEDGPAVALVAGIPMDVGAAMEAGRIWPTSSDEDVSLSDDAWNVQAVVTSRMQFRQAVEGDEPTPPEVPQRNEGTSPRPEGKAADEAQRSPEAPKNPGASQSAERAGSKEGGVPEAGAEDHGGTNGRGRSKWGSTKGVASKARKGKAEPYPRVRFPAGAVEPKLTVKGDPMPARGKGGAKLVVTAGPAKGQGLWRGFATMPEGTVAAGRDISGWRHDTLLTDDNLRRARAGEPVVVQFRPNFPVRLWRPADEGRETMCVERPWDVARAVKEARESVPATDSRERATTRGQGSPREGKAADAGEDHAHARPRSARGPYPVRVSRVNDRGEARGGDGSAKVAPKAEAPSAESLIRDAQGAAEAAEDSRRQSRPERQTV